LIGLLLLQFWHLAADYLLQSVFMIRNKGTYGHPGVLLHAGLTGAVLAILGAGGGLVLAIPVIIFFCTITSTGLRSFCQTGGALTPTC
jgi:hypothetical protein